MAERFLRILALEAGNLWMVAGRTDGYCEQLEVVVSNHWKAVDKQQEVVVAGSPLTAVGMTEER